MIVCVYKSIPEINGSIKNRESYNSVSCQRPEIFYLHFLIYHNDSIWFSEFLIKPTRYPTRNRDQVAWGILGV